MADISPGPENDYQATPTLTFSREVWNVVMASISARLKARELLEATFEAMIEDGTQAALDLISTNVAPQLSELSTQITSLQGQLEDLLDAGTAPNALKLAGEDPAFYLSLANATGTLPVAKVEGIDASIATAIDALTDGAPSALDTLKEFSDALGNDADFTGTMMAALAARLVKANNLSDLPDVAEALNNLGLTSALRADETSTISTGFTATAKNLGALSSFTLNGALGQKQYGTNNGAFTITAPTADTDIDLLITNGGTAGSVTFSGFTVGAVVGDALTTTNGHRFLVSIRRINGVSTYMIKALQ